MCDTSLAQDSFARKTQLFINTQTPWKTVSVGLWVKRAQQLVVYDLWREIRLEATKQASGHTNR